MSLRRTLIALPVALVGAAALAGPAAAAAPATGLIHVDCVGNGKACTARVNLAGGASNLRVAVVLKKRGMRLVSAQPSSPSLAGSYAISDQVRRDFDKEYVFTLNAVEAAPSGSAVVLKFAAPAKRQKATIIRCKGNAEDCVAKVPIGGGASNRKVVVQLPDTNMALASVTPNRSSLEGAYSISNQKLRTGGSEYVFTLSAVQGTPAGSYLKVAFEQAIL